MTKKCKFVKKLKGGVFEHKTHFSLTPNKDELYIFARYEVGCKRGYR